MSVRVRFPALAFAGPIPHFLTWLQAGAPSKLALANDPGETHATGEKSLAQAVAFDDVHKQQSLSTNQNDQRLLEKPGACLFFSYCEE